MEIPTDAPQAGETYRHYKGKDYKIVGLALHSDETWNVVYEPLYESEFTLFTRPVSQWRDMVEWEGKSVERFVKV